MERERERERGKPGIRWRHAPASLADRRPPNIITWRLSSSFSLSLSLSLFLCFHLLRYFFHSLSLSLSDRYTHTLSLSFSLSLSLLLLFLPFICLHGFKERSTYLTSLFSQYSFIIYLLDFSFILHSLLIIILFCLSFFFWNNSDLSLVFF